MTYNQSSHIRGYLGIYHFARRVPADVVDDSPTMMEAVDIYLRLKASNDSQTFIRAAKRNSNSASVALN
jgi:hypothetical protein